MTSLLHFVLLQKRDCPSLLQQRLVERQNPTNNGKSRASGGTKSQPPKSSKSEQEMQESIKSNSMWEGKSTDLGKGPSLAKEEKWNTMLAGLAKYKDEHKSLTFPGSLKSLPWPERRVAHWVRKQRAEYKKLQQGQESTLTASRLQRLNEIGLDLMPVPERIPWAQRMQSLREFFAVHGHWRPKRGHSLQPFVSGIVASYSAREKGRSSWLTDARVVRLICHGAQLCS